MAKSEEYRKAESISRFSVANFISLSAIETFSICRRARRTIRLATRRKTVQEPKLFRMHFKISLRMSRRVHRRKKVDYSEKRGSSTAQLIHSAYMRSNKILKITLWHHSKEELSDSLRVELLEFCKPIKWTLICLVVLDTLNDVLTRLSIHF